MSFHHRHLDRRLLEALEPRRLFAGPSLVADLSPAGAQPLELSVYGKRMFFSAQSQASGRELWVSDGTADGTRMVVDLWPGRGNANPSRIVVNGKYAYFAASSGKDQAAVYRSDGTAKGTIALHAIGRLDDFLSPVPGKGDSVLFQLRNSSGGVSLWRSDGTARGTTRLVEKGVPDFEETVYSRADGTMLGITGSDADNLWFSDGTAAGTRRMVSKSDGLTIAAAGGVLYYAQANTLYRVDRRGKASKVAAYDRLAIGSNADARYAFGAVRTADGKLNLIRIEKDRTSLLTDRGLAPRDFDDAAGDDSGFYALGSASSDGYRTLFNIDFDRHRYEGIVDIADGTLEDLQPAGDVVYVMVKRAKDRHALLRVDRKSRQYSEILSTTGSAKRTDEDAEHIFNVIDGRALFSWHGSDGVTELYALTLKTGRIERLTSESGSPADSPIQAYATSGGAAGRGQLCRRHA